MPARIDLTKRKATLLTLLRARAVAGERCPTRMELGRSKDLMPILAREGRIKIEVGGRNCRVVEIDGLRTWQPENWRPLYTISRAGKVLSP